MPATSSPFLIPTPSESRKITLNSVSCFLLLFSSLFLDNMFILLLVDNILLGDGNNLPLKFWGYYSTVLVASTWLLKSLISHQFPVFCMWPVFISWNIVPLLFLLSVGPFLHLLCHALSVSFYSPIFPPSRKSFSLDTRPLRFIFWLSYIFKIAFLFIFYC